MSPFYDAADAACPRAIAISCAVDDKIEELRKAQARIWEARDAAINAEDKAAIDRAIRKVRAGQDARVADGRHVFDAVEFQPVVDRRAPHRRRCRNREQARSFFLFRDDSRRAAVGFGEVVVDVSSAQETGQELSAEKHVVGGGRPLTHMHP